MSYSACPMRVVRNPSLDPGLTNALVRMWADVTNAGGAVGFLGPVTPGDVRPLAEATFDRVRAGEEDLVVAFTGCEPAGFGFLVPNPSHYTAHWATIARLQRDPARSGSGVGAAVLAELERLARERGFDFVALTVRGGTGREHFYEARGYQVVATHPGWLKFGDDPALDEVLLAKPLRPGVGVGPRLEVCRLDPDLPLPEYAHPGDAGLDLRTRTRITLAPGERAVVGTGLAVAIPPGYVGLVHPRSGLAARSGLSLVNSPGTIDSGYRGEIKVILINLDRSQSVHLERGNRIAQLLIQPIATAAVHEVPTLPPSPRAEGGFGSSGR
jgi:dUTP pyrophosphatase